MAGRVRVHDAIRINGLNAVVAALDPIEFHRHMSVGAFEPAPVMRAPIDESRPAGRHLEADARSTFRKRSEAPHLARLIARGRCLDLRSVVHDEGATRDDWLVDRGAGKNDQVRRRNGR